jgi:hypothetical protein
MSASAAAILSRASTGNSPGSFKAGRGQAANSARHRASIAGSASPTAKNATS